MNSNLISVVAVCCLSILAGCSDGSRERPNGNQAASTSDTILPEARFERGDVQSINVPTKYRLPGVDRVRSAVSWADRLADLPEEDRRYLERVNERYFDSLSFNSPTEQQQLVADGYLTPEDWLIGRDISDEEIRRLAEGGNTKAQVLYVDRLANALEAIYRADVGQLAERDQSRVSDVSLEVARMSRRMFQESSSPFAAYVFGRTDSLAIGGPRLESVAASFKLAGDRGDKRAPYFLQAFTQQNPDLNGAAVLAAYSYMQRLDRRRGAPQENGS